MDLLTTYAIGFIFFSSLIFYIYKMVNTVESYKSETTFISNNVRKKSKPKKSKLVNIEKEKAHSLEKNKNKSKNINLIIIMISIKFILKCGIY